MRGRGVRDGRSAGRARRPACFGDHTAMGGEMASELSDRKRRLRDRFIDAQGHWNPALESVLELDEDFFEAYAGFSSGPWRSGPLEPKIKELICLTVDAAATHLYAPG